MSLQTKKSVRTKNSFNSEQFSVIIFIQAIRSFFFWTAVFVSTTLTSLVISKHSWISGVELTEF